MITLIITYYNQTDMLKKQIDIWNSYNDHIKKYIKFVVVDDGSKNKAIDVIKHINYDIDLSLYEIAEDIYCNIPGAMNLGSQVADTKWLLHMDMDHYFNEENISKLIYVANNEQNINNVFKFNRDIRNDIEMLKKNPSGFKFHPKLCLISKKCYWNIGGFDEDFCGHYGRTDTAFFTRGRGKFNTIYLKHILLAIDKDGDAPGINRKDLTYNTKLLEEKQQKNNWSNKILRFNWKKIFI